MCFAIPLLFCGTHKISPSRIAKYPFKEYFSGSVSLMPKNEKLSIENTILHKKKEQM